MSVWSVYFETLTEIYHELQKCHCLFSLNEPFKELGRPSGRYRGIFKLDDQQMKRIKPLLDDGRRLYEVASEGGNRKGLPINFPKFIEDDSIFKMQIHINKAHLSKNYEIGSMVKVASVPTLILENEDREQIEADIKAFYEAGEALEKLGYEILIEKIHSHDLMYIGVKKICELYNCNSVQHRIDTGRQIRADYFSRDNDGNITKSKLQSIGILLIPSDQQITVLTSHDRKIRTDAIYTKHHPTEIILEQIPQKLLTGRLYRR